MQVAQPLAAGQTVDGRGVPYTDGDRDTLVNQTINPVLADEFTVAIEGEDVLAMQNLECVLKNEQPGRRVAVATVVKELKQEGNGDASPDDCENENIDVLTAQLPVGAVNDEFALLGVREKLEEKAGHVCWTQGMLVEEAFKAADDRVCFGVAWEALCERCVTHILGLDQGKNDEREKLDLALPVLRKVVGEIQTESNEFSV